MNVFAPAHLEQFGAALRLVAALPAGGESPRSATPSVATSAAPPPGPSGVPAGQRASVFFGKLAWAGASDATMVGEATLDALRATVTMPPAAAASSSRAMRATGAVPVKAVTVAPAAGGPAGDQSERRAAGFFGGLPWTGRAAGDGERTIIGVDPGESTERGDVGTQTTNLVAMATAQALQSARAASTDEPPPDRTSEFFARMPWGGSANAS